MKTPRSEWTFNPGFGLVLTALIGLLLLAGACSTLANALAVAPAGIRPQLVTAGLDSTATATPFGPIAPTSTPPPPPPATATPIASPTSINPWGDFPAPVEASAIEIHRPVPPRPVSDGTVNIMILGSDQRPYSYGNNTDVLMLLSLDSKAGTAKLLSFPRDLYVFIPGWRVDRINVAYAVGGPEAIAQTILYNFGLEVHHTVLLHFWDFTNIVDSLGGIYVEVGAGLQDECGGIQWSYGPGRHNMDGFQALCYVRMRRNTGDFDRLRRQQEVMLGIFQRTLSLDGLSRVPDLYNQFKGLVETDIQLEDVLPLVPLGAKLAAQPDQISRYAVDSSMGSLWRVPYSGASVILPNWEAIEQMLMRAFPP